MPVESSDWKVIDGYMISLTPSPEVEIPLHTNKNTTLNTHTHHAQQTTSDTHQTFWSISSSSRFKLLYHTCFEAEEPLEDESHWCLLQLNHLRQLSLCRIDAGTLHSNRK